MEPIISPNTLQVAILETGIMITVAIGVVNEGYNTSKKPGRENGTVGYQTTGNICDAENTRRGKQTKGNKNVETELSVNLIAVEPC